jgi:hypothetical protein
VILSNNQRHTVAALRCFTRGLILAGLIVCAANATENAGSVYPTGVETVMPGMVPAPGASFLGEFDNFYQANSLADGHGHSAVPGFHLGVEAIALKFVHNWGLHVLGGTLVSYAAVPYVFIHLDVPGASQSKSGFGNPDLQPVAVAYRNGDLHWWYGLDVFTPGFEYNRNDLVNIGQHNYALAPTGAFTYLPGQSTEISSKFQYIVNGNNDQTQYRSGNEFMWEYDGMRNITKKIAVGVNGFYYQQTTDDMQNGMRVGDGNRGRDFAAGPEIRCHLGHKLGLIAKYTRDMAVQNKTIGNSFWLQLGLPLGHGHE